MSRKALFGQDRSDYYTGSPWHPNQFVKGNINGIPLEEEFNSVILYHGGSLTDFFVEEETPRGNKHQESLFETKVKLPGNSYQSGESKDSRFNYEQEAIFGGVLEIANKFAKDRHYPSRGEHGLVYEFQLPTANIEILIGKICLQDWLGLPVPEESRDFFHLDTEEKFVKLLGGPENSRKVAIQNLRKIMSEMVKRSSKKPTKEIAEQVQFGTPHQLHIENAVGYWSLDYSKKPVFLTYDDFRDWLLSSDQFRDRIPPGITADITKEHRKLKERHKDIEVILEEVSKVEDTHERFYALVNRAIGHLQSIEETQRSHDEFSRKLHSQIISVLPQSYRKRFARKYLKSEEYNLAQTVREERKMLLGNFENVIRGDREDGMGRVLSNSLDDYVEVIETIFEVSKDYLDTDEIERKSVETFIEAKLIEKEFRKQMSGIKNTVAEVEQIEKKEASENSVDGLKDDEELEKELAKGLKQNLQGLPDLRPLRRNCHDTDLEKFVEMNIDELDKLDEVTQKKMWGYSHYQYDNF